MVDVTIISFKTNSGSDYFLWIPGMKIHNKQIGVTDTLGKSSSHKIFVLWFFNCISASARTLESRDDCWLLHFVFFFLFVCLLKVCR